MKELTQQQVDFIGGGVDLSGLPVAVATGAAGAAVQWYKGAGWLSTNAMLWGAGGAALGFAGYYGVQAAINYFQGNK